MRKTALVLLWTLASSLLFAQGEGEMTVSSLNHCHSPNSCASVQSLTAKWNLTTMMGELLVRVSFKWTAGGDTPANFFDGRDFIVLRCVASGSSQVVGYIRSGADCPVSGKGYGHNMGGSPSWTSLFCDSEGNSLGYSAEKTKEIWKKGFSVAGVSLVRSGGLDADKPRAAQAASSGGGAPTTTVTGSPQSSQRVAELQAKQRQLEEQSKQRQQQQQQQAAQERSRQQQADRGRQQTTTSRSSSPGEADRYAREMAINQYNDAQRNTQEMLDKVKQGAQDIMNTISQTAENNRRENEKWKAECAAKNREWEENEARKKREQEEQSRQYWENARREAEQSKREEEAKAAQATLIGQNRLAIVNEFKASTIPLSSELGSADKLYYFGFSYNGDKLKDNTCTFYITPTFEVGRRADGTWPYLSNVVDDLYRKLPYNTRIMHGAYSSYDEAEQVRQTLIGMLTKTSVTFKDKEYAGKVATVVAKPLPALAPALKASFEGAELLFASGKYSAALAQLLSTEGQPGGSTERVAYLKLFAYDGLLAYPHTDSLELLLLMHQAISGYLSAYANHPIKEKYAEVQALQEKYNRWGLGDQRVAGAMGGNAEDQYQLGMIFYRSELYPRAVQLLARSAEQKHPKACGKAGVLYDLGIGRVKPNPDLSAKYLRWAVEANDWEGISFAAYQYREGVAPFAKDAAKAAELFRRAYDMSPTQTDNNDADAAMYLTGHFYRYGSYGEPNYDKAYYWYSKAAQRPYSIYQKAAQAKVNELSSFLSSKRSGDAYFSEKNFKMAIWNYNHAYSTIKDGRLKSRLFEAQVALGDQLFHEKKNRYDAQKAYDEAGELVGDDPQKLAVLLPKLEEFVYDDMRSYSFDCTYPTDEGKLNYYLASFPNGKYRRNLANVIDYLYPGAAKSNLKWDYYNNAKRLYLIAAFTYSDSGKAPRFLKKVKRYMKKRSEYGERYAGFSYEPSTKDDWTKGKLVVTAVQKGSPAGERGLLANDVITHISGIPVEKLEPWQASELMRSFKGDETSGCYLTVIRPGEILRRVIYVFGR
ncbi:PDZ domain-containing protein [uncultured Acetobacteroides sp.]|uniref:PDZ domain-containing protein n=1 Tax=uncultured Acetobacteroides sp. TaxID=1760811 RepID=UPI0029F4D60A|nr:PDZ domain-containing protein [uncultured Acetobacteroides sp.]